MKFKTKKSTAKNRNGLKAILSANLPDAISARIVPFFGMGGAALVIAALLLPFSGVRRMSLFFAAFGAIATAYALWQKADVIRRGYDEYLFKVVDYTYLVPMPAMFSKMVSPTGMLLLNKTPGIEEDQSVYHVAAYGKAKGLPPLDWIIRVYVPKGSRAAVYSDRKYFPTVYGYKLEREDTPNN